MGVRGLTTYIAENADRYLDAMELHDCNVVVDGDSLSCQLYKSINSAFGGNYDDYFRAVCKFFRMLQQCNVTAYVLLDGGYLPNKLYTVKQRLRAKIGAIKHLNPFECQPTFPILMREVFVEALECCDVSFMRCTFEADHEVAALSRKLKCPVLSFDSDFYIHDVLYIPSVSIIPRVYKRSTRAADSKEKGSFLKCSAYQISNLTRGRCDLREEMVPLFAILLGNDYISTTIFKKFFLNVSMKETTKKSSKQGKRIVALLRWLQNEQSLQTAIDKIINHIEKDKKAWIRHQINLGINGYKHEKSLAFDFFMRNSPKGYGNYWSASNSWGNTNTIRRSDSDSENSDNVRVSPKAVQLPPDWLIRKIIEGKLPRYIADLLTMKLYINAPQVENFQLPDSNRISIPILQLIFTILHQPNHNGNEFRYLTRIERRIDIEYKRFKSLDIDLPSELGANSVECVHNLFKLTFMKDFENFDSIFSTIESMVPSHLRLLFIAIIYWSQHSNHFNIVYASCLLLSQIVLSVVIPLTDTCNAKTQPSHNFQFNNETIEITRDECTLARSHILHLFSVHEKMRTKHTEFSSDIIHGFAEFQSIVFQLNCLNVLCNEPYQNIQTSKCINGCFLYNSYVALKDRPDINYYVDKFLFTESPNLFRLYSIMISIVNSLGVECPPVETKKKKRRKCKKKKPQTEQTQSANAVSVDIETESDFEDLNNKFSCLLKM